MSHIQKYDTHGPQNLNHLTRMLEDLVLKRKEGKQSEEHAGDDALQQHQKGGAKRSPRQRNCPCQFIVLSMFEYALHV